MQRDQIALPFEWPVADRDEDFLISEANRAAWGVLTQWEKPFLTAFSDGDPITGGAEAPLQQMIPGARGREHPTVPGGHFLQEDKGEEIAGEINRFLGGG